MALVVGSTSKKSYLFSSLVRNDPNTSTFPCCCSSLCLFSSLPLAPPESITFALSILFLSTRSAILFETTSARVSKWRSVFFWASLGGAGGGCGSRFNMAASVDAGGGTLR